jgi:hypothetical protein
MNRRRHINALPGLRLLTGFSVGAILLAAGLGYVYCQNELHRLLGETGKLEREFQELRRSTEAVEVKITKLSSKQELKQKLDNGFFKLTPIASEKIIVVPIPAKSPGGGAKELHPVSNGRLSP